MNAREGSTHFVVAGVIVVLGLAVALFAYRAGAAFAPMYADFGGSLPWSTRVLFTWWAPACAGAITASPAIVAIGRPRARWIAFSASAVLALLLGILALWAVYAPIFELAGNIQAD